MINPLLNSNYYVASSREAMVCRDKPRYEHGEGNLRDRYEVTNLLLCGENLSVDLLQSLSDLSQ